MRDRVGMVWWHLMMRVGGVNGARLLWVGVEFGGRLLRASTLRVCCIFSATTIERLSVISKRRNRHAMV